jgi:hypothetical protein
MAIEQELFTIGWYVAAEDLSAYQFHGVVKDATSGQMRLPDSAFEEIFGVLQNFPSLGQAAAVMVEGVTKWAANGALAIGTHVGAEYVGAADAGKARNVVADLHLSRGVVIESAGAEDDLASVLLHKHPGTKLFVSVPIGAATANTHTYVGAYANKTGHGMRLVGASVASRTKPSDADGTLVLAITKGPNDENLLGAASYDLEGLTAKAASALALTATAGDLVIADGEMIYVDITSDSAAIDTNISGGQLTLELAPVYA